MKSQEIITNGKKYLVKESDELKTCVSADYNYIFRKSDGYFARWGLTTDDDPQFAPFPEILDLEISVNDCSMGCPFCYKDNNSGDGKHMSFETFKTIIDKMPFLTQVAFGITDIKSNPDFFKMMEYCRHTMGIIPNFTMTGIDLDNEYARKTSELAGAVAISCYPWAKELCYNTIEKLHRFGMDQINIHLMLSKETLDFAYEVAIDSMDDERLSGLNCIVFLGLKPKGRAKGNFTICDYDEYADLVKFCMDNGIRFGADSCGAPKIEHGIKMLDMDNKQQQSILQCIESCEVGMFSSYINVGGKFFTCSFSEGEGDWKDGIDVLSANNFIEDVWNHPKTKKYREMQISSSCDGCRKCLIFPEIN